MDLFQKADEHTWIQPKGVLIRNVRRKRPLEPDVTSDNAVAIFAPEDLERFSKKKSVPVFSSLQSEPGRKQSIFTLSSNNYQIAEERTELKEILSPKRRRHSDNVKISKESTATETWHRQLCVDWSLKSFLRISSKKPYEWSSGSLKYSEKSAGTSAFVRCVDIEPVTDTQPKLDTSLGAQFHQCSLYWQHPYLPSLDLFPRDNKIDSNYTTTFTGKIGKTDSGYNSNSSSLSSSPVTTTNMLRFDEKTTDCMQKEWGDAFQSSFQLLRLRQSPYFYVCSSAFTALFCAAGTRDHDMDVYITPSTKGFRDTLKKEGIQFEMPWFTEENKTNSPLFSGESSRSKPVPVFSVNKCDEKHNGSGDEDEEPDKWLDDMGISQDVSISNMKTFQGESTSEAKTKSTLIIIKGEHAFTFFNYLLNTKHMLVTPSGPLAGIPPTIFSPVAFHGASLRALQVKQKKVKNEAGQYFHLIEMSGPILPHAPHMLCGLLSKTVGDYKINFTTLSSTIPLNNENPETDSYIQNTPDAFALQSLSDCGLTKSVLEVFCQCKNSCRTIKEVLHRRNTLFKWH